VRTYATARRAEGSLANVIGLPVNTALNVIDDDELIMPIL
jgi:hypothetical protein